MKKTKRFILVAMIVLVLSYSLNAFAAGETLSHAGHSRSSYTSVESVPQKTDQRLQCTQWSSTANMTVTAVTSSGGLAGPAKVVGAVGNALQLYTSSSVRNVHVKITNAVTIPSSQPAAYSSGSWTLYTQW